MNRALSGVEARRATATLLRNHFRAGLLVLVLLAVSWPAFAAPDVDPPPISNCEGVAPPSDVGSTPLTPGRWWNPKRIGTGWDFYWSSGNANLTAIWYTYEATSPVWLITNSPAYDTATNTWRAQLLKFTWNAGGYVNPGVRAGSMALRFFPNDPTRAALRWQWDSYSQVAQNECIFDYFRYQVPTTARPTQPILREANVSYSGFWHEPLYGGWGLAINIANVINVSPSRYIEFDGLQIYDDAGEPVWLQAQSAETTVPPPDSGSIAFGYFRALATPTGYPSGYPVNDCTVQANCIYGYGALGAGWRTFTDTTHANAQITVNVDGSQIGSSNGIHWNRPASGSGFVPIEKLTTPHTIVVDRTSCAVPQGQSTCPITVNWGTSNSSGRAFRRDLATGVATLMNDDATGTATAIGRKIDNLAPGARVQYELYSGPTTAYPQLSRTPEVRATGNTTAPDQAVESLAGELPAHNAALGAMDGAAGVDGGAATYTIPIKIPPGRRGMQPNLALVYSSRGGPGIAGLGLSVSGLSSIHRCPATPEQDGAVRAVRFVSGDSGDRLCLDGQRLVKVAGTAYGAAGSVYRKEIDDFTRVTLESAGGDINSPSSYFRAELKSGEIIYYGATSTSAENARTVPSGTTSPLAWQIKRREDRVGNNVVFAYLSPIDGESLVDRIFYTGHNGGLGTRSVRFVYVARSNTATFPDQSSSYLAGTLTRQTRRLDRIQAFASAEQVREYRITGYGASPVSGRGRTTSITECAYAAGVPTCLPPTSLAWQDSPVGQPAHQFTTAEFPSELNPLSAILPAPVLGSDGDGSPLPMGYGFGADYDGNGSRDLIVKRRTGSSTHDTYLVSLTADRQVQGTYLVPNETFLQSTATGGKAFVADFDSDGRADVPRTYTGKLAISSWTPGAGSYNGGSFIEPPIVPGGAGGIVIGAQDWLEYAGDVNGDGKSDVMINRPSTAPRCTGRELFTYFNTTPGNGVVSFDYANPLRHCLPIEPARSAQAEVARIVDFDGNGLVDVMVEARDVCSPGFCEITPRTTIADFFLMGTRDVGGGTFSWAEVSFTSAFPTTPTTDELDRRLFTLWVDLNGDGLDDFLYADKPSGGTCQSPACWSYRLNKGRAAATAVFLGPRVQTASNAGIEFCAGSTVGTACSPGPFQPKYGNLIRVADIDADGRAELLIPNATQPFAALVCQHHVEIPFHNPGTAPDVCDYIPNSPNAPTGGEEWDGAVPCGMQFYMCPENPRTDMGVGESVRDLVGLDDAELRISTSASGAFDPTPVPAAIAQLTDASGQTAFLGAAPNWNPTIYNMNVLRFFDTGAGTLGTTEVVINGLTASALGAASRSEFSDIYGDGLTDHLFYTGCFKPNSIECGVPWKNAGQDLPVPQTLFGAPILKKSNFLSENLGVGRRMEGGQPQLDQPSLLPDMVLSVTNGAGASSTWDYFPLGSQADRTGSELPFYSIPPGTLRYVDDRHFYFTSSMPAVAELFQTNGVGGLNVTRYGYSEAMYHHQGRGFRGFRTVTVDDTANKRRTKTTFAQKYPLTSAAESVDVYAVRIDGSVAPLSSATSTWRCYDTPATLPGSSPPIPRSGQCVAPALGTTKTIMPFLDATTATTYDAAVAETIGTPAAIAVSTTTNAEDAALNGNYSTTSGYDVYGNLLHSTTVTQDLGNGAAGFRKYVAAQRKRVARTFQAVDITNWWLDRISTEVATTKIEFDASNALPGGVSNPTQAVTKSYVWNAPNRTPQSETLQPGAPNQQIVTTYAYPGTNYGLPSSITVQASGDTNGSRVTSTVYTVDGYFPAQVTNALLKTTTTTFRDRDGQPSLIVDPNGFRTTLQYDAFGTLTRTLFRGASDTVYRQPDRAEAWSACTSNCPPNTYRIHTTVQDGAPTTVEYQDYFGRTLKVDTRLLDLTTATVETRYDDRGLVTQTSEPYRVGTTPIWTTFDSYDVLGRVTQKTVQKDLNDGLGDLRTIYKYSGRQTQIDVQGTFDTCPGSTKCLTLYRETDSLGRITWTQDATGVTGQTRYWFDGDGNALAIRDANNAVTSATYNAVGHRTNVADPNMGASVYTYNALGEVLTRRDARNITTSFSYDKLGRTLTKFASVDVTGEGTPDSVSDSWVFDPPGAFGQLASSSRSINSALEKSVTYGYDTLARPTRKTSQQNQGGGTTQTFLTDTAYDAYYGRPKQLTYTSGDSLWLRYTKYGHLNRESDWPNTVDYRRVTQVNARGQATTELLGASLTASYGYTGTTGQMTSAVYTRPGSTVRQLGYQYDVFGNVTRQELGGGGTYETYGYDKLMRLTQATRGGGASGSVSYAYDAVGNFTSKSDYSTTAPSAYTYTGGACGGGPNAVKSVALSTAPAIGGGTRTLCYDPNGNLASFTTAGGQGESFSARYDHDNLPYRTIRAGIQVDLTYDADGGRVRQSGADGTRLYDGAYEKVLTPTPEQKVYLGDYAVLTRPSSGGMNVKYLLKDRLGSVDTVTDAAGSAVETRGYDAFGKPREGTWADKTPPKLGTIANTSRGFTQHEHLNAVALIHMNGRAYDYQLGRFLSVDPIIQFPTNSQSLNPYSYILNNPLAGTDPSGFATCSITANADQCLDQNGKNTIVAADGKTVVGELNFGSKNVTFSPTSAGRSFGVMNTVDGSAFGNGAQGMTSLGAPGGTSRGGIASTSELLGQGKAIAQKAGGMVNQAGRAMFPEVAGLGDSGLPSRSWKDDVGGGMLGLYNTGARLVNAVYSVGTWAITAGYTSPDQEMFSVLPVPEEMRSTAAAVEASTALLSLIRVGTQGAAKAANAYSVAFETTIPKLGIGTRASHFRSANEAALAARSDPVLASMFQRLGIKIPTNTIGAALGRSPLGWTWHHVPDRPGVLQLVPTSQHQWGSAWQALFHPNREGGFKIWGAEY